MSKVYIVAAKRTAIGKFLGTLAPLSPAEIAAPVIQNILAETKIDPADLEEVIVGNILMAGHRQGIARQAAIKAGVPYSVPAYSVNMMCGSGMKSIMTAFQNIKTGDANLILAGGVESMSNSAYLVPGKNIRNGQKMGDFKMVDHMICDGLTDAFEGYHMGITAENIAEKYSIPRQAQDEFAYDSQQKAIVATDKGFFRKEIVPVEVQNRKETTIFDTDEYINRSSSLEKLATLKPAFKKDGTVTAGNASGLNDGASFVLVASEEAVKKYNLKPLAEIVATGQGGLDPGIMGMGPVVAIESALKKANMNLQDMQLIELNQAFASQALGVMQQLCEDYKISMGDLDKITNVNGGAIALGHPIGASGNRIVVTLIHEMLRRNVEYGLASLCIGGGMGTAIILKKV
ncbi:MAG: acetyl-CoA C-acetyltransferase [Bacteroidales bacterium]|nr:acetyl-CoA C-acetyltransferase [Bacteroidales bacterium]